MSARLQLPDRYCALDECGMLLTRRPGERPERWRVRTTCDVVCRAKMRRSPATAAAATAVRHCAKQACGAELVRGDGERPGVFGRRNYCDDRCRRTRHQGETRPCEGPECDVVIVREAGLSQARWDRKRFHDRPCQRHAEAASSSSSADRKRARAAQRSRDRRAAAAAEQGVRELSVFGDVPPAEAWRPAAFRDPSLAGRAYTVA